MLTLPCILICLLSPPLHFRDPHIAVLQATIADPPRLAGLNSSVNGRPTATVPPASICHDLNYNATLCNSHQQIWLQAALQSIIFTHLVSLALIEICQTV